MPRRDRGHIVRAAARGLGDLPERQLRLQIRALRRGGALRADDARVYGIGRGRDRPAETAAGGDLRAGPEAAAHHHGARRIELRHPGRPRRQGAAGLRFPFPVLRRQGAPFPGRGRRRPELVHRVQRAGGPVGALVRAVRLFRDADRRRAGRARPADGVAPLRLPHLLDLPGARRLHERAQLPDQHRDAEFLRPAVAWAPTGSSPTSSTTTPRAA